MGGGPEPGILEACHLLAHATAAALREIDAREAAEKAGEESKSLRGLLERSERQAALFDLSRRAAEELEDALGGIRDEVSPATTSGTESRGDSSAETLRPKLKRAADVLDELRSLTTLAPPRLQVTDLNAVIHDAVAEIRSTHGSRGVSLRLQAGLPSLLLDVEKVRRILANLLSHGLEGQDNGQAVVTSRLQKGQAVVEIRVPGRSTPGSVLENVFVPFGAGDGSRRSVGLSLAHQIIKDHGGQLRAKSEPGEDLLYWLSLPVEDNRDRRRVRRDRRASRDRRQGSDSDDGPLES
jgi:signal transduction histidine kinase